MADISQIEMPNGSEYNLKDTIARKHLSYFGTCATAAATAAKVVTVDEDSFELQPGVIIGVHFSASNTADDVTLNVNNTGAKEIYYNNAVYDGHSTGVTGYAKRTIFYMYDGTHWVFLSQALIDSNTDTKVRQTLVTGDANRPLLMAYSANTATTTNVDNVAYRNNSIYANPSTGKITANGLGLYDTLSGTGTSLEVRGGSVLSFLPPTVGYIVGAWSEQIVLSPNFQLVLSDPYSAYHEFYVAIDIVNPNGGGICVPILVPLICIGSTSSTYSNAFRGGWFQNGNNGGEAEVRFYKNGTDYYAKYGIVYLNSQTVADASITVSLFYR